MNFSKNENTIVESIAYTKESSVIAYLYILTTAIQEVKAGRNHKLFDEIISKKEFFEQENSMVSFNEFKTKYIPQSYDIVSFQINYFGGVTLSLEYQDNILLFWIYPLTHSNPSIKSILKYKDK